MSTSQSSISGRATLPDAALDQLFRHARTYSAWLDIPVPDDLLRRLYDLMKWAPTSANLSPARLIFVRTAPAKARLLPALGKSNIETVIRAPVTAIVAYDMKFYEQQPRLYPLEPRIREQLSRPHIVETTAQRNSSLQGAYLILAARSLGLDCGPLSGFSNAHVDNEFLGARLLSDLGERETFSPGCLRSNFLCNIGYGDHSRLSPRLPRLTFEEACCIL